MLLTAGEETKHKASITILPNAAILLETVVDFYFPLLKLPFGLLGSHSSISLTFRVQQKKEKYGRWENRNILSLSSQTHPSIKASQDSDSEN